MCFLLTFPTGHLGCEELTHLKRPWCCEGLKAGGEEDNRGWDGWMASLTQWAWVWVNSGSWWWTGRPGMLQSMGLQRVRHNWATELNWTGCNIGVLFNVLKSKENVFPGSEWDSECGYGVWNLKKCTLRCWSYMEWKSHSLAGSDTVYLCGWYSHILQ